MKALLVALLALAASVGLALFLREDVGYVMISYGHWTIEVSLALFLVLDFAIFAALYMALRSFFGVRSVPRRMHNWRANRLISKAQIAMTKGTIEMAEGNWKQAEKHLLSHVNESKIPLVNYLAAAQAAHQQGNTERRDEHIKLAHESMPTANLAIGLTQAELQLANEQNEEALATLEQLRSETPKHPHLLKLLAKLYEAMERWDELEQILPELKKHKLIEADALSLLNIKVHAGVMFKLGVGGEVKRLTGYWRTLPNALRSNTDLMETYAQALLKTNDIETAAIVFAALLPKAWNSELVLFYGNLETSDNNKQLTTAEGWLTTHQKDADLLLTVARLSMRSKLWGKARSYLEASINLKPQPAAYNELGKLLEEMEESDMAMSCYRSGLAMITDKPIAEEKVEKTAALPNPEEKSKEEAMPALASS
jgi:HemY protein